METQTTATEMYGIKKETPYRTPRFDYLFDGIEGERQMKTKDAKQRGRQPDTSNPPEKQVRDEMARIDEWYSKEINTLNKKLDELESLKDLPEVETVYSDAFAPSNPEIEQYLKEGYEIVGIHNITGDRRYNKQKKLYKFKLKENK